MWSMIFFIIAISVSKVNGQVSGCPLYGCSPSGSFSLDPVLTSPNVQIAWTTKIDNSSSESNIKYGCVSNGDTLICPTAVGYVSLDPKNGKELWRTKNLLRPTLPLVDIYGNVIGCDGQSLVKIDSDGSLEPIIHLELPLDSIYSLNLMMASNAFLIVSENGMVVAYLTNGVPLASLQLNGTVDNQKGTFHPIASPVISGYRSYILTEFKAEESTGNNVHLMRLFALEIADVITDRIRIAWFVDLKDIFKTRSRFETDFRLNLKIKNIGVGVWGDSMNKGDLQAVLRLSHNDNLSGETQSGLSNVLIESGIVYISLSSAGKSYKGTDKKYTPTLIAINDTSTQGHILFQNKVSISHLASDSISSHNKMRSPDYQNNQKLQNFIWANNESHIVAFDSKSGKTLREFNISGYFKNGVNITSNLMITLSGDKYIFTFGLKTQADRYYLAAMEYDLKVNRLKQLYKVECSNEVTGQIISVASDNTVQMLTSSSTGYVTAFKKIVKRSL